MTIFQHDDIQHISQPVELNLAHLPLPCPMPCLFCLCVGVTVIGEVNAWTSNVMNLIWLIGTFTFAVVLAVVTEDIVATVLVSVSMLSSCTSSSLSALLNLHALDPFKC